MVILEGYKQTDVGIIPQEWECTELGSCVSYIKGFPFKSKDYKKNGVRIIRVSDTTYDSITDETAVYIDSFRDKEFEPWKLNENDIVLSTVGSKPPMFDSLVGKAILINSKYSGSLLNQNAVILRSKTVNQKLIYANLRRPNYIRHIELIFRGNANQASITLVDLFKFKFALPKDESEQRRIAEALSDTDALISALEKLIDKKRAIKQGALQELLTGKRRLDGFSDEWVEKKVGDIGYCYSGLTGKSKENFGVGEARYITFLNVLLNTVIDTTILERVDVGANESQNSVQKDDLFFNTSSETPEEVGMCAVLEQELSNTYLNSFCFGFRIIDNEVSGLFLSYLFNSNVGRKIMTLLAQGATRYNLSKVYFNDTMLQLPTIEEQTAIASILSDMDAEIDVLATKLDKLRNIKQGMMSELLTGRIRLLEEV